MCNTVHTVSLEVWIIHYFLYPVSLLVVPSNSMFLLDGIRDYLY